MFCFFKRKKKNFAKNDLFLSNLIDHNSRFSNSLSGMKLVTRKFVCLYPFKHFKVPIMYQLMQKLSASIIKLHRIMVKVVVVLGNSEGAYGTIYFVRF